MLEIALHFTMAALIAAFYCRLFNDYRYGGVVLWLSCWLGPDAPKVLFKESCSLVSTINWYLAAAILFPLLVGLISKYSSFISLAKFKRKRLNILVFIEIGLVLHLTLDYFFHFL